MRKSNAKEIVRSRCPKLVTDSCRSGPAGEQSRKIGYLAAELAGAGEGIDLGLGCGEPLAMLL